MTVHHHAFKVQSEQHVTFHDVTGEVEQAVADSGVRQGIAAVYSQHTTCSVILQEDSHDTTANGTKFLLRDMLDIFDKLAPSCERYGQYRNPGDKHLNHATRNLGEEAGWSLNTDAHLRSCLLGRSETMPIVDGKLQLGEFGQVYFADFDTVRARERTVRIQIVGE
jgi:secondary thiamine-phosphate synthase enzyme